MDIDSVEAEITSSIRDTLKSRGIDESHIKIKAKTRTASVKLPVKAQGVKEAKGIMEWPNAVVTTVKMKLSVEFIMP